MSQEKLANGANLDRHFLSDVENQRREFNDPELARIASVLEVTLAELKGDCDG